MGVYASQVVEVAFSGSLVVEIAVENDGEGVRTCRLGESRSVTMRI